MRVESLVLDTPEGNRNSAPQKYLSALLGVANSARKGEYVIVLPGSGSYFRTDSLGALAAQALINGRADCDVIDLVEGIEAGAGGRARQLIGMLDSWGAMTVSPPRRDGARWRLRRAAAIALGTALGLLGQAVHIAPTRLLAWTFRVWPLTPVARHIWRCSRFRILLNLRASGYGSRPEAWLQDVGRRIAAEPSRNYLFNYVSVAIPARRLDRLVNRLFDRDSLEDLAVRLEAAGPVVAVFLHGPLCTAVPNALRARGHDVIRVVVSPTHGINLAQRSGRLGGFFGDSSNMAVEENDPNASGALLRHLKAGRSVYVALDKLAGDGKTARVEMVGRDFARNDGPAWLAVQSRRALAFLTTHNSRHGVVIAAPPLLYPDPSLPVERRVSALSQRLYAYAEAAIREHPAAWTAWSDLSLLEGRRP